MKIYKSDYKTPYENFALEELMLKNKNTDEDILLLYQNLNSVIIGRNQNSHEEVNWDFIKEKSISVARRISGGGAVFQDEGNVNFCFITSNKKNSYEEFLKPIINFLKTLGLDAAFSGKNDVTINGIKISGNAQYKYKNNVLHHGTLLFNSKLDTLGKVLKPNKLKLESKSIKSVRQRVSNINDLLETKMTTDEFIIKLINFFGNKDKINFHNLAILEDEFNKLVETKKSDGWNLGKNPPFSFKKSKRFDGGTISLLINTENNLISNIKIVGDFMSNNEFENIYKNFIGVGFSRNKILQVLKSLDNFSDYFGKITQKELLSMFMEVKNV